MEKSIHTEGQQLLQRMLRQMRKDAGLTQEEMAARLGTFQSTVSDYERGERRLDLLEARQVCRAAGLSFPEFVARLERALSSSDPVSDSPVSDEA